MYCVKTAVCAAVAFFAGVFLASSAFATALEVSPVSVEIVAPTAAATMTLRNRGTAPINVQIRVFKWSEVNGEETLEPTTDVVASPPMTAIASGLEYTIRLVRVKKQPVSGAEFYRVLVDELPKAPDANMKGVTLVLRYSIPVFFYSTEASPSNVAWSIQQQDGHTFLSATNAGDMHARIASLKILKGADAAATYGEGLAGYVLGHSTRIWQIPDNAIQPGDLGSLAVTALTNSGPIRVIPRLAPSH